MGIGASAGGLQALQAFLSALPEGFGSALVFVQHLSPTHDSLLLELLRSRWPDFEIHEIADGNEVQAGHLHVGPPGQYVRIRGGRFRVMSAPHEGVRLPVDTFLASPADDVDERAIAVILSGAGTDGARGVQAVHDLGGTVFAQAPETAEFASMPLAAIATGQVGAVLAPPDIAREIQRIHGAEAAPAAGDDFLTSGDFDGLCGLLEQKTGHRFHPFKRSVVARRVRRRLFLCGFASVTDYVDILSP